MGTLQTTIPDDLEELFRAIILEKYHKHQLKPFVETAIKEWILRETENKKC